MLFTYLKNSSILYRMSYSFYTETKMKLCSFFLTFKFLADYHVSFILFNLIYKLICLCVYVYVCMWSCSLMHPTAQSFLEDNVLELALSIWHVGSNNWPVISLCRKRFSNGVISPAKFIQTIVLVSHQTFTYFSFIYDFELFLSFDILPLIFQSYDFAHSFTDTTEVTNKNSIHHSHLSSFLL